MKLPINHPLLPGLLLVSALSIPAWVLGEMFPLVGGAVMGMLLGLLARPAFKPSAQCMPGIQFAGKQLLQYSIVAMGFCLPIQQVAKTGMQSLEVTAVTLSVAFGTALILGRLLKIPNKLNVLIGAGTAICGGSAIAAITPALKPDEHDTAYALSTIFLFNIVAVLLFPLIGGWLNMSDIGFGLWAGTAINDTSSVIAAGYAWSEAAGNHATIVKLTRAMMIVPITLIIAMVYQRRQLPGSKLRISVPWFIVFFVFASAASEVLPAALIDPIRTIAPLLIIGALTAIGLSTDVARLRNTGWRPLVLGLLVWVSVATSSLLVQHFTGAL